MNIIRKRPPNVHIFWPSFAFFTVAVFMFVLSMVLGQFYLPLIIREGAGFRSLHGVTLTHLMTLGWITMLSMGASFQIMQIILRTSIYSRTLIWIQFALYVGGLAIVLPSFREGNLVGVGTGGSFIMLAVFLYTFNLIATMISKREWSVFQLGLGLSLLGLIMTVAIGVGFALVANSSTWGHLYEYLFQSHLWLSLGAWVAGLIVTFSYKLMPMFYISDKKPGAGAWWTVALFHVGIWLMVLSAWRPSQLVHGLAVGCLLAAALLFARYVNTIRKRARAESGIIHLVGLVNIGFVLLFCIWLVGAVFLNYRMNSGEWTAAFVLLLIAGWFSANILGYLAKIIPFLWWAYRFHTKWEKKSAVLLKNMLSEKRLRIVFSLYLAGIATVTCSVLISSPFLSGVGQFISVMAALIYIFELTRAFRY